MLISRFILKRASGVRPKPGMFPKHVTRNSRSQTGMVIKTWAMCGVHVRQQTEGLSQRCDARTATFRAKGGSDKLGAVMYDHKRKGYRKGVMPAQPLFQAVQISSVRLSNQLNLIADPATSCSGSEVEPITSQSKDLNFCRPTSPERFSDVPLKSSAIYSPADAIHSSSSTVMAIGLRTLLGTLLLTLFGTIYASSNAYMFKCCQPIVSNNIVLRTAYASL